MYMWKLLWLYQLSISYLLVAATRTRQHIIIGGSCYLDRDNFEESATLLLCSEIKSTDRECRLLVNEWPKYVWLLNGDPEVYSTLF